MPKVSTLSESLLGEGEPANDAALRLPEPAPAPPPRAAPPASTTVEMDDLAAPPPASAFALPLRDAFGAVLSVEVSPSATVLELKKLVCIARDDAEADVDEHVDAMVVLHNGLQLEEDTTVGSHGLSPSTTVTLSSQDPAAGRAIREARAAAAKKAVKAAAEERRAQAARMHTVRKGCALLCLVLSLLLLRYETAGCDSTFSDCWDSVPPQCRDGMGAHPAWTVPYKNHIYRVLDDADPRGDGYALPNLGCQCLDDRDGRSSTDSCPSNWLALPDGWSIAPNDADSQAVVGAWDWSTDCAVLSDGRAYNTGERDEPGCDPLHEHCGDFEGEPCGGGSDYLISAAGEHTVRRCRARILIKCP